MNTFGSDIILNVVASVIASAILLGAGYAWGKYKERRKFGRRLEEYDFYPYTVNRDNFPEFNPNNFRLGMHYFLRNNDPTAARQLIFIGEQNNVRSQLEPTEQKVYARLFDKYEGKKITGRNLRDGTTNLVIDLKKRQIAHEDKLNYELNIGARKFKCTTVPIIRKEYGVVGAICINIDANYLTEEVMNDAQKVRNFFETFCRTDMQLDENILSRDEYQKALKGKRHWRDDRAL